jgi:hypothetical protein
VRGKARLNGWEIQAHETEYCEDLGRSKATDLCRLNRRSQLNEQRNEQIVKRQQPESATLAVKRDQRIDQLTKRMAQTVCQEPVFTIYWAVK